MKYEVEGPDGNVYEVEGPDDATDAQIIQAVKWQIRDDANEKLRRERRYRREEKKWQKDIAPTRGFFSNLAAGAGKIVTDAGLGVQDAFTDTFGSEASQQAMEARIAEKRRLDAPLMKTGGGVTGAILGGGAMMAPASLIPGANSMVGAGIAGGLFGASQPTMEGESRAMNTGVGAVAGAAGQGIANRAIGARQGAANLMQSEKGRLVEFAREQGIRLDPAATNPTFMNRLVRGFSGRAKFEKKLSVVNQKQWNKLAREDLGLAPDVEITPAALRDIRSRAHGAYRGIGKSAESFRSTNQFADDLRSAFDDYARLVRENPADRIKELDDLFEFMSSPSFDAKNAMQRLRMLRDNAEAYTSTALEKVDALTGLKGRVYGKTAKAYEKMIEENLEQMGRRDLFEAFTKARQDIARSYTYEKALVTGGDIDIHQFGIALKRNKELYGHAKTMGELARAFPQATRRIPGGDDPMGQIGVMGGGGAAMLGHPLVGAAVAAPSAARALGASRLGPMLGNPYSSSMAQLGRPGLLGSQPGQAMSRGMAAAAAPATTGFWNPFEPEPQQ
jgi:hypothetical protein